MNEHQTKDQQNESRKKSSIKCCRCNWIEPTAFFFNFYFNASMTLSSQLVKHMLESQSLKHTNQYSPPDFPYLEPTSNGTKECRGSLSLKEDHEILAQTSIVLMYADIAAIIPAFFTNIILGAYSDSHGRLDIIMICLVGNAIRLIIITVMAIFNLNVYLLVLSSFVESFFGMSTAFWMGAYAYLSDMTNHEERSRRLVLFEVFAGLGGILSNLIIGYFISSFGFIWSLIFLLFIILVNMIYVCFLNETVKTKDTSGNSMLSLKPFSDTYKLYTKPGENRRWELFFAFILISLSSFAQYGSENVKVLFIISYPLCLSPTFVGYFLTLVTTFHISSNWISTSFLGAIIGDSGLALLGCISGITFYVLFAASLNKSFLFSIAVSGCLMTLPIPILKALASKIVKPQEIGLLFGSLLMAQMMGSLVGVIVQNDIYALTVDSKPYAVFLTDACVYVLALTLLIVFIIKKRREPSKEEDHIKIVD